MGDREIYEQMRQPLMAFAVSLVGPDQAADLVSEAMVSALRRSSFADLTHPKTYLMTAVLDEAKSRYRRTRREDLALRRHATRNGTREVLDVIADPDIQNAVLALPPRKRAAIYLVYWIGHSPSEAAGVLSVRPSTLRRYLHLATTKLRGSSVSEHEMRSLARTMFDPLLRNVPSGPDWEDFETPTGFVETRTLPRPWLVATLSATVAAVAIGGVGVLLRGSSGTDVPTAPPSVTPVVSAAPANSTTATSLEEPPASSITSATDPTRVSFVDVPLTRGSGQSVVWTGTEIIVWGGRSGGESGPGSLFDDGAAFAPEGGGWRVIAPSPLTPRSNQIGVWTGSEMLILGGADSDGAAYNPLTDSWRSLPRAPVRITQDDPIGSLGWVWSGRELIVWHVPTNTLVAYEPASNTWSQLLAPPFDADIGVLRLAGSTLVGVAANLSRFPARVPLLVGVLDTDRKQWTEFEPTPMWTEDHNFAASPMLTAVVDGRLLTWTESGNLGPTKLVELSNGSSRAAAGIPLAGCEVTPQPLQLEEVVLAFGWCGDFGAIYDPATEAWATVDLPGLGDGRYSVWTGSEIFSWGEPNVSENTIWRYRIGIDQP